MTENPTNIYINFYVFGQAEKSEEGPTDGSLLRSWVSLTDRERQVALKACRNLTNDQIAQQHYVSSETVKAQMASVLQKFGMHSKSELRFTLVNSGLVSLVEDD